MTLQPDQPNDPSSRPSARFGEHPALQSLRRTIERAFSSQSIFRLTDAAELSQADSCVREVLELGEATVNSSSASVASKVLAVGADRLGGRHIFVRLSNSTTGLSLYPANYSGRFNSLPAGQECALLISLLANENKDSGQYRVRYGFVMDDTTAHAQLNSLYANDIDGVFASWLRKLSNSTSEQRFEEIFNIRRIFAPVGNVPDESVLWSTTSGVCFFACIEQSPVLQQWRTKTLVSFRYGEFQTKDERRGHSKSSSLISGTFQEFSEDNFQPHLIELEQQPVVQDYLKHIQATIERTTGCCFEAHGWKLSGEVVGFNKRLENPAWLLLCRITDKEGNSILPSLDGVKILKDPLFTGFVMRFDQSRRGALSHNAFIFSEQSADDAFTDFVNRPTTALLANEINSAVAADLVKRHLLSEQKARKFKIQRAGGLFCGEDEKHDFYALSCQHRLGETILIIRRSKASGAILSDYDYTIWGFAPKLNLSVPR